MMYDYIFQKSIPSQNVWSRVHQILQCWLVFVESIYLQIVYRFEFNPNFDCMFLLSYETLPIGASIDKEPGVN